MQSFKNRLFSRSTSILAIPILLIIWKIVSVTGIFDPFLFPSPVSVLNSLYEQFFTLAIIPDLTSTLTKIVIALAVGSFLGFLLGVLLAKQDSVYHAVSPLLDFFRSIPATALFPLFLLIFGSGDPTNIALATWICALYLSLHVAKGLRSTSETSLLIAKSLQKSQLETFLHVRLREALPFVFVGLRTAASLTVVVIIVTEMFVGTTKGLGKSLIDAAYTYEIPKLYAGILLVGIIGYLLNYVIIKTEKTIIHWHGK